MPNLADMQFAMNMVRFTWGAFIPPNLRGYSAQQITLFPDEEGYQRAFRFIYDVVFKAANNFNEEAHECIDGVLAFVSPTFDHAKRKIYISPKVADYTVSQQRMILSHEYIHWLSHENFYPTYYIVGGANPFRVEGLTHWMTKECGYHREAREVPAYESETLKADSWLKEDKRNRQRMLDFIFNGVRTDLGALHP